MARDVSRAREYRRSKRYREGARAVGRKVKELRQRKRWTLEKASERMGLDFRHLQQIEAGTVNLTLATILRISDAFDCPPFQILPGTRSQERRDKLMREVIEKDEAWRASRKTQETLVRAIREVSRREPGKRRMKSSVCLPNPIAKHPSLPARKKLLALAIAEFRKANGFTQKELAKLLDVTEKRMQAFESGKWNPRFDTLIGLAAVLNVDLGSLVEFGTKESEQSKLLGQQVEENAENEPAAESESGQNPA